MLTLVGTEPFIPRETKQNVRYWLIGCGGFVLIAGVLVAIGIKFISAEIKDFMAESEVVLLELDALDEQYPFTRPEDGVFPEERFKDYVSCRRELKGNIDATIEEFVEEDLSLKKRISLFFDLVPAFGRSYAESLRGAAMPPGEYDWFTDQTLLVLRYAEHPDAPDALKALRRDLDALTGDDNPFRYGEDVRAGAVTQKDSFQELLPEVEPLNLSVPAGNVEIVMNNADAIRDTKELFFFDTGFNESLEAVRENADSERSEEE